jgi:hypothetical protein
VRELVVESTGFFNFKHSSQRGLPLYSENLIGGGYLAAAIGHGITSGADTLDE